MKNSAKKLILQIHLWLGLASGLVIFILGITGSVYVFEKELKDIFYKDRLFADQMPAQPLSLDTLTAIAKKALGSKRPVSRIEIQPNSNRTYIYSSEKRNKEAVLYTDQCVYAVKVYINPFTGRVQYIENSKWEFFRIVLALHFDLMLGSVGHVIVPWAAAVFVVMLITGIVLWWPKNKAMAKQRFWFKWKATTKWKRKNYDLHNIPGFYILLIALVISLSGMVFGFKWFGNSVKFIANGGRELAEPKRPASDTTAIGSIICLEDIYKVTLAGEDQAQKFLFIFPDNKKGTLNIRSYYNRKNNTKQNLLAFDQYTGKLLQNRPYNTLNKGEKLRMANYDIHVGKILGLPGMILALIAGLVSASLPVTGFIIWWGKRKKSKPAAQAGS